MSDYMQDPLFWYAIAFTIFCALAYWKMRKPMLGWLDGEISKIRDDLAHAHQLRSEAEALLADYKKKHAEAMIEVQAIIRHAESEAAELQAQAAADLKTALTRREQQAADRIRVAEAEALAAVRAAAADRALELARKALAEQGDGASRLVDQAIAELPEIAGKKAQAA